MFNRFAFWFAILSFAAMFAVVATAAPAPRNGVILSLRDADLTTPMGARTVLARIKQAADYVCGGDPGKQRYTSDTPILKREFKKCRDQAVANAVATVRSPLLQTVYAASRSTGYPRIGRF